MGELSLLVLEAGLMTVCLVSPNPNVVAHTAIIEVTGKHQSESSSMSCGQTDVFWVLYSFTHKYVRSSGTAGELKAELCGSWKSCGLTRPYIEDASSP